jgi:hypothetical protein
MMSGVSLLFEAVLATLMVALIVYCIKLNKRLSLLRNQNAEFADMMVGLGEASERAEQSVQHLKAAGLSAERSLRSVIEDAAVAQADLSRLVAASPQVTATQTSQPEQYQTVPSQSVSSAADAFEGPHREKIQRDMLIGEPSLASDKPGDDQGSAPRLPSRPKTREEAEETVLQAIRSARVGI